MNLVALLLPASVLALAFWYVLRIKGIDLWIMAYLRNARRSTAVPSIPTHVMVCVADHFEPQLYKPAYERECARVHYWVTEYRRIASRHQDADGKRPQHTFFYPEEEYRLEHLEPIAELCKAGFGDVEIHLHHDHDTAPQLREKLERFKSTLYKTHGLLHRNERTQMIEYGFIHGNWALDNSGENGRGCGVNNELIVLRDTGCYADFTFPSSPSRTQPRTINSIYYAIDDPERPKSHDSGVAVSVGVEPSGDLMMIQGPLTLNWKSRKAGVLPRIENGELTGDNPPTASRVDLWVRQHIHIPGRPEWLFIKLHTHGANEDNATVLLEGALDRMWTYLEQKYNDGVRYRLHYVTAREMYNIIRAAEAGLKGDPNEYRSYGGQ